MAAIRELITTFEPEFQDEIRNNIVLAGGGSQIKGLPEVIESNLTEFGAARVTMIEDPVYACRCIGCTQAWAGYAGKRMGKRLTISN